MLADSKGFRGTAETVVVERTHAWYERCRRLIMHHDRLLFGVGSLGVADRRTYARPQTRRRHLIMSTPSQKNRIRWDEANRFGRAAHLGWRGAVGRPAA